MSARGAVSMPSHGHRAFGGGRVVGRSALINQGKGLPEPVLQGKEAARRNAVGEAQLARGRGCTPRQAASPA